MKRLLKMNLQFFGGGDIEIPEDLKQSIKETMGLDIDDVDLEDVDDDIEEDEEELDPEESEIDEDIEDSELEEEEELDEEDSEEETQSESRSAIAERKKWQKRMEAIKSENEALKQQAAEKDSYKAIVDQLAAATGKKPEQLKEAIIESQIKTYVEQGMKEELARQYVQDTFANINNKQTLKNMTVSEKRNALESQANEIAKNPNYSGIKEHLEEVIQFSIEKGLDVKQSYTALYAEEIEKKMSKAIKMEEKYKTKKKSAAKVNTSTGKGVVSNSSGKLTNDQRSTYDNVGLSSNSMAKMKGIKNISDYRKAFPKKKER